MSDVHLSVGAGGSSGSGGGGAVKVETQELSTLTAGYNPSARRSVAPATAPAVRVPPPPKGAPGPPPLPPGWEQGANDDCLAFCPQLLIGFGCVVLDADYDPNYDCHYYFHVESGVTQWERPTA